MTVTPDQIVWLHLGPLPISATLVFTWVVMALTVLGCWLVTRRLRVDQATSRWQQLLEALVGESRNHIRELIPQHAAADAYLPFIGGLFVFIAVCNFLTIIPGYMPPTGSINTTAALALLVFILVPVRGIRLRGFVGYLRQYLQPSVIMLPMNVLGEFSRTLALAMRLFGNVMSGGVIAAILLMLAPFVVPVVMQVLGLLVSMIHAYIFAVLALVYIASAAQTDDDHAVQHRPVSPPPDIERTSGPLAPAT